jgi:hypothetical protein
MDGNSMIVRLTDEDAAMVEAIRGGKTANGCVTAIARQALRKRGESEKKNGSSGSCVFLMENRRHRYYPFVTTQQEFAYVQQFPLSRFGPDRIPVS